MPAKKNKHDPTFNVRIPPALAHRVRVYAAMREQALGQLVTEIFEAAVPALPTPAAAPKARGRGAAAYPRTLKTSRAAVA